jgi:hypothetical protein
MAPTHKLLSFYIFYFILFYLLSFQIFMQGKENGNVLSKRKCIFNSREKLKKKLGD